MLGGLQPPTTSQGTALAACAAYSFCSVSMVLVNKALVNTYDFRYNMTLLAIQNSIAAGVVVLAGAAGWVTHERLDLKTAKQWAPITLFFAGMLYSSLRSIALLSIPMVTVFKNATNILIVAGDATFFGQTPSRLVLLSLVLMVLGALMAAVNDLQFSSLGYTWMCINCVCTAAYVLSMRAASQRLSRFGLVLYNNALSVPLIVAVGWAQGEMETVMDAPQMSSAGFITMLVFSGVVGFALSLASFWCVNVTSATTYAIIGALNKVPLTVLGVVLFNTPLSAGGAFFVALGIAGGMLFSYSKLQEQSAKEVAKHTPPPSPHPSSGSG